MRSFCATLYNIILVALDKSRTPEETYSGKIIYVLPSLLNNTASEPTNYERYKV